ncbi:hypothetical protein [Trebonia sp.]
MRFQARRLGGLGDKPPPEPAEVRAADREQGKGPGTAPAGELAQVEGAGLAGHAAVPGQEPGERKPLGAGEGRLDAGEAVEEAVAVIMAPVGTDSRGRDAGPQAPASNDARNV